jgi:hypothetical protein
MSMTPTQTGAIGERSGPLPGLPGGIDRAAVIAQMIRRANSAGFDAWWQRIEVVGFCANPIHLTGVDRLGREREVYTRCNNRRAVVCPSCSDLYGRDTCQLIHARLHGGHHDVPASVADHPQVFVTLTAPPFGPVHTVRAAGRCHPRGGRHAECQHGKPLWCDRAYCGNDAELEDNPYAAIATTTASTCCSRGTLQSCGGASPFVYAAD